jgi:putative mRNA 3-end processing factor
MAKQLLQFTDNGIFCAEGNFYIDPWRPVDDAVLTHAHADHARTGSRRYLAHELSREILKYRLGAEINLQTIPYGETVYKNGVQISLFPAGHIIGSAQVRVEYQGEVWVVSGDYKVEDDGISTPFESVRCHHFISECTFGMPVYQWKPQNLIFNEINRWWEKNIEEGKATIIAGYSLGKAQRILCNLDLSLGTVFTHGVIENTNDALRRNGIVLPETVRITPEIPKEEIKKGIILLPPSAVGSNWMRKLAPFEFGFCSGWMNVRGAKKRRAADRGFVLSDHADWDGLIAAIDATGCESVYLTHGYTASFSRYLRDIGFDAHEVHTLYGGDESESEVPSDDLGAENEDKTNAQKTGVKEASAESETEANQSESL